MRTILFNLRPAVGPEEQKALLDRIGGRQGVRKAVPLRIGAKLDAIRRMCYVEIEDDADADALRSSLAALPEVESADVPAARGLL